LAGQAKEFQKAFRKIRGLRRGLGNRLSNIIRSSFKDLALGGARSKVESLDERLGIPLDELLETIDVAEVTAIRVPPAGPLGLPVGRFAKRD
jgi:hypothetical protein